MTKSFKKFYANFSKVIIIMLGATLYSIGLEIFLIPNNIIDGGVVGISIMANHFISVPLGLLTFILNIPFFIIGYKQIGKTFTIATIFSVICYSIGVSILKPIPGITHDILLAAVFGGILVGLGIGLIMRSGGSTDGTEIVAIILDKRIKFSVGEIIMFFNFFILLSAGFIFGWDRAMYSLITYFIVIKVIDIIIEGTDESKAVVIISDKHEEISEAIMARLGRGMTYLYGKGGKEGEYKNVIYVVVSRLEISKLKCIVNGFDEDAFITIGSVETTGKSYRKKAIH
ncbi:YitT family protein [Clostridium estertheticum]|uniref:YitT family protein n=1 Tax=Clostridium estertheticum TaxID=238834 RepID=A0AA47I677_9CLOT|nr:YitT family protein [Clostridium estertheticum]MBU3155894.1 YitT family protein [Clostridium estertheticum]MBU3200507.1 YitT family protein [Clostridium estertheticum]WAG59199.1 YitT family protein [Clostridium estertheticum]WAG66747.1 YitT family protein [Clostridium estertheticum]